MLGLDAFFQRDGVAQPQVVAMRGARHVAAERCAARGGLALELAHADHAPRDLARADDVELGGVRELGIPRRLGRPQIGVQRVHQPGRGLRAERLAQLRRAVAHQRRHVALLRALFIRRIAHAAEDHRHGEDDDGEREGEALVQHGASITAGRGACLRHSCEAAPPFR